MRRFYNICPDTDPGLLGIDDIYQSLVATDDKWPSCGDYMEAYPCVDSLGYSPPGDKTAKFYGPGDFPSNGTKTTSNIAGAITSPVSGDVYTWTAGNLERVVTVASADAKPSSNSNSSDHDDDDDDDDSSSSGNGDSGDDDDQDNDDKDNDDKDDDEDAAVMLLPRTLFIVAPLLLAAVVIM